MKKKRLFYVSHPYGGKKENKEAVQSIIDSLKDAFDDSVDFISPIHVLGPLYHTIPYIDGLNLCLSLLDQCECIVLCGDWQHSRGCMAEYGYAIAKGILCIGLVKQ